MIDPPIVRLRWTKAHRIINSRYPPIDVFERVADPSEWDALFALEQLTNPRVRQEWGYISLVPPEERVSGPGATWIMAAFTHVGLPTRFSDGSYGVYYAARLLETAIRETAHHYGRFLRTTAEPSGTEVHVRVLVSTNIDQRYHDVRVGHRDLHDPDDYAPAQALGRRLRAHGANGIVYRSVRHDGGECVAVLRPRAIPKPTQGAHLRYHFDGARIDRWFRMGEERWQGL